MQALADAGASVDVIDPGKQLVDLSDVRVDHDLYVLKKTSSLALSIAAALHAQGAAIVNPYPVSMTLRDRIVTSRLRQRAGVPRPASYVASQAAQLAPLLDESPIIVKPYQGSEGVGVRVVRGVADLAAVPVGREPVFAQRYHAPQGRDRKIYAIGGRLFGVKKVFPARTEDEKRGEPFTPSEELRDIAQRSGGAFGIDLYSVDIIESNREADLVGHFSIPRCGGGAHAA